MAATIGNFSSGNVLTAAQMNTLGLEFLDDQTFTGFGGVSSDVLSSDFSHYMVQFVGTNANSTSLSLRFRRSSADITTSNYDHGSNIVTYSTGTASTSAGINGSLIRIGSLNTGHSFVSMFVTLNSGNAVNVTWQHNHQDQQTWQGAGHFSDGSAVTGLSLFRSSGSTTMRMRVYGFRN
jgi:hypothetical protein